jgi:phosphoribosylanthranilate isomerase
MKRLMVQIYEIRTPAEARALSGMDIDAAGFWAASTPRDSALLFAEARAVRAALPEGVKSVALCLASDEAEITALIRAVEPDIVHLGSRPEAVLPEQVRRLKAAHPSTGFMRSIPVSGEASLQLAASYDGIADYLLLDTRDEATGNFGATGMTHDWDLSRRIVLAVNVPVILAGGLTPDNVAEAVRRVRPAGVDSKTGTDRPGTHEKDFEKVARFVRQARAVGA